MGYAHLFVPEDACASIASFDATVQIVPMVQDTILKIGFGTPRFSAQERECSVDKTSLAACSNTDVVMVTADDVTLTLFCWVDGQCYFFPGIELGQDVGCLSFFACYLGRVLLRIA